MSNPSERRMNPQEQAGQGTSEAPAVGDNPQDPEQLRQQIEQTREELGETVEALAKKADVKGQAKEKVAEGKDALREKQEQAKEKVAGLTEKVTDAGPNQVKETAGKVAERARERPLPVVVTAGAVAALGILFYCFIRRW